MTHITLTAPPTEVVGILFRCNPYHGNSYYSYPVYVPSHTNYVTSYRDTSYGSGPGFGSGFGSSMSSGFGTTETR